MTEYLITYNKKGGTILLFLFDESQCHEEHCAVEFVASNLLRLLFVITQP